VGIGEATSLIFWLATSYAGVALYVLPGDASGVSRWRRLGRRLYLDIYFDLGLGRRLGTAKSPRFSRAIHVALLVWLMGRSIIRLDPRGALCMADGTFSHSN